MSQIFAAYVEQQALEKAVEGMVFVSSGNLQRHEQFMSAFDHGLLAARDGDQTITECVNLSGYRARTPKDAVEVIEEVREAYLAKYEQRA